MPTETTVIPNVHATVTFQAAPDLSQLSDEQVEQLHREVQRLSHAQDTLGRELTRRRQANLRASERNTAKAHLPVMQELVTRARALHVWAADSFPDRGLQVPLILDELVELVENLEEDLGDYILATSESSLVTWWRKGDDY